MIFSKTDDFGCAFGGGVYKCVKGGLNLNQYFKASEAENYVFYKVPKALFTDGQINMVVSISILL